jgi:uncharacterized membrane protein
MIGALLRTLFLGLLAAGVIHVVAVLTIPDAAPGDAVKRVERVAPRGGMTPIPANGSVLGDLDPFFVHAVCSFDVGDGAVEVEGDMPRDVWTVAVVAGTAAVAGSLEHGSVADDRLDLVIGRAEDVERIRLDRAGTGQPFNAVEVPNDVGFVLLRAFAGPRSDTAELRAQLSAIRCGPVAG